MTAVQFNHSNQNGRQTLSVHFTNTEGEVVSKIVTPHNPSFPRLVTYLATNEDHDVDYVHGLVDPAVGIGRLLREEFGDRVTFDSRHFYIDGIPETGVVHDAVKEKVLSGAIDWQRYVRFFVRLTSNPSKKAQSTVWAWVEKHGVSLAEDGRMIGFKGLVNGTDEVTGEVNVPISVHRGPNNFIDGVLYGTPGTDYKVPHRLGSVISKRRSDVDDNTSLACSTGLHVGAYSYAKTFGENREDGARYSTMGSVSNALPNSTFALVAFSPADVVSVPEDGSMDWKIRVSEYEVVEFLDEVKDVLKDKPIYDVQQPAPFIPRSEQPYQESEGTIEPEDEEDDCDEVEPEDVGLVCPTHGTGLLGRVVLRDWAALNPGLAADLADTTQGHKALGRKYAAITTESSVRRYRRDKGIR